MSELADILAQRIRIDENGFGNIWPVFSDPELFPTVVAAMAGPLAGQVNKIVGIESRGFVLGAAVAAHLQVGFVAIRKDAGLFHGELLSGRTHVDYRGRELTLRLQAAALDDGDRVAVIDDWFETGSQALIAKDLIVRAGAEYVGSSVIVDQLSDERRALIAPCYSLLFAAQMNFPK